MLIKKQKVKNDVTQKRKHISNFPKVEEEEIRQEVGRSLGEAMMYEVRKDISGRGNNL